MKNSCFSKHFQFKMLHKKDTHFLFLQSVTVTVSQKGVTSTQLVIWPQDRSVVVCVMTAETTVWVLSVSSVARGTTETLGVLQKTRQLVYVSVYRKKAAGSTPGFLSCLLPSLRVTLVNTVALQLAPVTRWALRRVGGVSQ